MKIYIGSLPYSTTEAELKTLFSAFGKTNDLSLVKDKDTGKSKGYAFIEMKQNIDADNAINALNGSIFQGKEIKVNQAQLKEKSTHWHPGM
ncbi:MAG: RNA recognition motif domain-containing protein [Cellvibrionaceae bacterium]